MTKQMTLEIPKKAFNECYVPCLYNEDRYLVLYGGAGSGKSVFIAQRIIMRSFERKMCNLMVVRAVDNTNRDSTFALLKQIINKWNLGKYFKVNNSDLRITNLLTLNEIIFKGLNDSERLKSVTFAKGELTDVWIEEASEVLEEDFNQIDVRLRGKGVKKQIVISFNPVDVNHWLKKRFFDRKSDNVTIVHTTYKDNNFLDDDYIKLLESYKELDPYYYAVYCLGQWGVYGKTVFNAQIVSERLTQLQGPIRTGFFTYIDTGTGIKDIEWHDDHGGYIAIYEEPKKDYPYVIGGDTAGEGSDFFAGHVLDNTTGKQVAVLHHKFDEDIYARQMYCLGMHYNTAMIGIEANFSTHPIRELERLRYPRMYVRETIDSYTHKPQEAFGFKTTMATRPVIIANLVAVARESIELFNDEKTLHEMLTFVRNEKGRPEAQNGAHDDLIISLAIAHHIRPSHSMRVEKKAKIGTYTPSMLEDWNNSDAEMKKIMEERYGRPY
jgi:phage terminase large subunit